MSMKKYHLFLLLAWSLVSQLVHSQDLSERASLFYRFIYKPYDFKFQLEDSWGAFTSISNKIFKPQGDGPFPAVVLMHTSGGS